jgi:hypothetical protein
VFGVAVRLAEGDDAGEDREVPESAYQLLPFDRSGHSLGELAGKNSQEAAKALAVVGSYQKVQVIAVIGNLVDLYAIAVAELTEQLGH